MKQIVLFLAAMLLNCCSSDSEAMAEEVSQRGETEGTIGKTLVVYYSYTGNCREIVATLTSQIEADVVEIQPAEMGLKYEANGYALGTQLLNAIKANPNDAASYPAIDPVATSLSDYQNIIVVTPLWWSQMAAIMQTFLFQSAAQMAGKHVGLIVSSHSSGISGVVSDARRLLPDATWMGDALWINASNHAKRATLIESWLKTQDFAKAQTTMDNRMNITIGGQTQSVTLADNAATKALTERLQQAPINVSLSSSGDFEIWGALGFSLPTSNQQTTAQPGDIVLYNGSNICIFYGTNSWSYTRLGKIDNLSESELRTFLKAGESQISVTLSLPTTTAIAHPAHAQESEGNIY
nr:NAD(P)H-dependent oxidoreductase [Bacteroidaceae bacterium]